MRKDRKNEAGFGNIVPLVVMAVFGLIASDIVPADKLAEGKVTINKQVIADRQPVDYDKMNK